MLKVGQHLLLVSVRFHKFSFEGRNIDSPDVHHILIHIQKTNMVGVGSTEDINFLFVVISC